jgi:hypothetical protein
MTMIRHSIKPLLVLLLSISIYSCDKEVEILDEYKDIPIVYGLIDAADSISYLRIQKAYLSVDDIYDEAQIIDSNIYQHKLDVSIQTGNRVIQFDTMTIKNKEEGLFFNPEYPIYYAVTKDLLDINQPLELEIKNPKTGNIATSTAHLMDASTIDIVRPTFYITLLKNSQIDFTSVPNIRFYQLVIRFHYMEMLPLDSSSQVYKYADLYSEIKMSNTTIGGENMNFYFRPSVFLGNLLIEIPPSNELERYLGRIELMIQTSEESFYTYYHSVQPNNSVIEYPTFYTNIENGYGIFAGRSCINRIVRVEVPSKPVIMELEGLNFIGSIPGY